MALMVLGGALGPGFGACDARGAAPLCVAGVVLINKISTVVKLCRIDWFFGFMPCRAIAAVM